jgi:transmembrane sensor
MSDPVAEAAAWLTEKRGGMTSEQEAAFKAWLGSPENARAFARVERLFDQLEIVKSSDRHGFGAHFTIRGRKHWALALAASLLVALGIGFGISQFHHRAATASAHTELALETGRGEIRAFHLADGSTITLDTASRATVQFDPRSRLVRLDKGKARIAVAIDPRPFMIEAGAGQVKAGGSTLDVAYDNDRILVSVVQGTASVAPLLTNATWVEPVRPVSPGETFAYGQAFSHPTTAPTSSTIDATDWPSGWVEYRSVALSALVADANRYAAVPIVVDDRDVGELAVTGRFHLTDTHAVASRLAEVFELQLVRTPDGLHLRKYISPPS